MTKTRRLRQDIEALLTRRQELQIAVDSADEGHREAQALLLNGFTTASQTRAANAFASRSSLAEALQQLDRELDGKRVSLQAALTYEQQASEREHRARLEQQAEASLTSYKELRHKAAESLQAILPKAVGAWREFLRCRRELGQLSGRVDNLGDLGCYQPIDAIMQALLNEATRPTRAERKAAANARNLREAQARQRENELRNRPQFDQSNRLIRGQPKLKLPASAPGWTAVAESSDDTPEAA